MIFTASCMVNGSPGPSPGAPLKSPIVSFTTPLEPTEPAPAARLIRLKRLNISERSCTFTRSVIGMSLKTEKSTSANPGPWYLFRERLPNGVAGDEQLNAAGLTHCAPPIARLNLCETPAKGSPTTSHPGRCVPELKLNGVPPCIVTKLVSRHPCVSNLGPQAEPGTS